MAKGRKLTTSRSECFLGSYDYGHSNGTTGTDVSELNEEDVWSLVDDMADREDQIDNNSQSDWSPSAADESNGVVSISSRHRHIPRADHLVGGLSAAFEDSDKTTSSRIVHQFGTRDSVDSPHRHHMATSASAPVNVPDWSKIYRVDSVESLHDSDERLEDCDLEMVPPHEYLAREYARSRKTTVPSVFEGVGRTLKGRDMRRVRDAVWSQTGFDG